MHGRFRHVGEDTSSINLDGAREVVGLVGREDAFVGVDPDNRNADGAINGEVDGDSVACTIGLPAQGSSFGQLGIGIGRRIGCLGRDLIELQFGQAEVVLVGSLGADNAQVLGGTGQRDDGRRPPLQGTLGQAVVGRVLVHHRPGSAIVADVQSDREWPAQVGLARLVAELEVLYGLGEFDLNPRTAVQGQYFIAAAAPRGMEEGGIVAVEERGEVFVGNGGGGVGAEHLGSQADLDGRLVELGNFGLGVGLGVIAVLRHIELNDLPSGTGDDVVHRFCKAQARYLAVLRLAPHVGQRLVVRTLETRAEPLADGGDDALDSAIGAEVTQHIGGEFSIEFVVELEGGQPRLVLGSRSADGLDGLSLIGMRLAVDGRDDDRLFTLFNTLNDVWRIDIQTPVGHVDKCGVLPCGNGFFDLGSTSICDAHESHRHDGQDREVSGH